MALAILRPMDQGHYISRQAYLGWAGARFATGVALDAFVAKFRRRLHKRGAIATCADELRINPERFDAVVSQAAAPCRRLHGRRRHGELKQLRKATK